MDRTVTMSVPRVLFELPKICLAALLCGCVLLAPAALRALIADEVKRAGFPTTKTKVMRPNASIIKAQVLLARQGVASCPASRAFQD